MAIIRDGWANKRSIWYFYLSNGSARAGNFPKQKNCEKKCILPEPFRAERDFQLREEVHVTEAFPCRGKTFDYEKKCNGERRREAPPIGIARKRAYQKVFLCDWRLTEQADRPKTGERAVLTEVLRDKVHSVS